MITEGTQARYDNTTQARLLGQCWAWRSMGVSHPKDSWNRPHLREGRI